VHVVVLLARVGREDRVGAHHAHDVAACAQRADGGLPDELVAAEVLRRIQVAEGEDAHS
jgi:hypothetical protein